MTAVHGIVLPAAVSALWFCGCGNDSTPPARQADLYAKQGSVAMLTVESPDFEAGAAIPRKFSGEGKNVSPALTWSGVPAEAQALVLIVDDPDAPGGEPYVHWVVYDIKPDRTGLPEGSANGATEGKNSQGGTGYTGPMPPPGRGVHHYHFKLYALGRPLKLKRGATKSEVLAAMKHHVIAEGELVGTYERK